MKGENIRREIRDMKQKDVKTEKGKNRSVKAHIPAILPLLFSKTF